jgi:dihydrofolate synthase/folylpolyglutamate synthase
MTGGRQRREGPESIRPGLERIKAALDSTGNPERTFRTIHIAGTNGKGSTASFIESILRRLTDIPVGLYTSPHLVSPEERIRVNGVKIPAGELRRALEKASDLSRGMEPGLGTPMSWFEEMTWAACDWFRKSKAAVVVMEAGLGGRWDATTACDAEVSVITPIGIDHREWLGTTLREIAAEKAEIVRHGVPVVLGKLRPVPRRIAVMKAHERKAPVWESGREFGWEDCGEGRISVSLPGAFVPETRPAMAGGFQRDNAALACAAAWRWAQGRGMNADDFAEAARAGIASANWPGRFSSLPGAGKPRVWVDGSHNPDAARVLAHELGIMKTEKKPARIIALWSMLRDKDIPGYLKELSGVVDGWVVFRMAHERGATVETLEAACRSKRYPHRTGGDFEEGWAEAKRWAGPGGIVIVCGSLAAVGEAYRRWVGEVP